MSVSVHITKNILKVRLSSFTFTGKERDEETGYGYFGARYMDHELMTMWLSVDPMADKYPGISPYAYCAWNPVKLVDPDGMEIRKFEDFSTGELLGEINDGVDETVRVTSADFNSLQSRYDQDVQNQDERLSSYNEMIDRYSIGKVGYEIAQVAKNTVGSQQWAYANRKDEFGDNTHKCNKYVYDVLSMCGIDAHTETANRPPLAGEWADPNNNINLSTVVNGPVHLGDIVGGEYNYSDATGHVSIVTGIDLNTGRVTSTSAGKIKIKNEGFVECVVNGKSWGGKIFSPVTIRRF